MAHTYAQNNVHLVFSTKNRAKLIARNFRPRLWSYVGGICKNHGILCFAVGGMEDHLHVLFRLPPSLSLIQAVKLIKSNSSKWMNELGMKFSWQQGYGAFSVSSSLISKVVKYIDNQDAHHRKITYDQEFIALLKKHGVEYDPHYVFG